ncbi:hypothetical protein ACFOKI_05115 [Sphingomonas qilianensis]|uniref:Uncharacterized protein n=1 Tax=Sphingomonas qilianensis TaxID=1736690 RepID=A0ABU9XUQ4_9SPHN
MNEPSLRTSRVALAAGLAAVAVVGGGGFLLGRSTSARDPAPAVVAPIATPAPSAPIAEQPAPRDRLMSRADLIALAAQAADAVASGQPLPAAIARAEGRRFTINLPFGCQGPADQTSDAPMRWRYDGETKVLRVHVAPAVWDAPDLLPAAAAEAVVAVEGFWIARPWSSSDSCPPTGAVATPSGADAVTLPGQTLAIAQFFGADDIRQGRRGDKPYEAVVRAPDEGFAGTQGLRLRITGRIAAAPGGGPVTCRQPAGAEQRPICVIAIASDEIAIADPISGNVLATWAVDGADAAAR